MPIIDTYSDTITGASLARPALNQMLARLGEYTHIYCYDYTRLARSRRVAIAIRDAIAEAGATLRLVVGDTSEMDDEARVLLESVLDGSAEAERLRIARRMRVGRENRARAGLHAGKIPWGWMLNGNGRLVPDPAWDAFFTELERLFLAGLPYNVIARQLAGRGFKSPRTGRPFSPNTLRYIIANPWHQGHVVFGWTSRPETEQVIVRNAHQPRWANPEAVSRELARRRKLRGATRKRTYRLTGVMVCDYCGWRMIVNAKTQNGKVYVRYICGRRNEYMAGRWHEACHPNHVTERSALAQIADFFRRMVSFDDAMEYLRRRDGAEAEAARKRIEALRRKVAETEQRRRSLIDRLGAVADSAAPAVAARINELTDEIDALRQTLAAAQEQLLNNPHSLEENAKAILELRDRIDSLLTSAPPATVQAALQLAFPDGIRVRKGRLLFGAP